MKYRNPNNLASKISLADLGIFGGNLATFLDVKHILDYCLGIVQKKKGPKH